MEGSRASGGRRALVVAAAVVSGLAALVVAAFVAFLIGLHCTSGDGGAPYVAPDSAQATVCNVTGEGVLLTVVLLVAGLALIPLALRFGRAWAAGKPAVLSFVALLVVIAALPAGTLLVFVPFSSDCSAAEEAAVAEWQAAGGGGDPPYACETY